MCSVCVSRGRTCVLQDKAIATERGVATEGEEKGVVAALDPLGDVSPVEAAQQGAEGVWSVVDVEEVITGLQAEPEDRVVL